MDRSQLSDDAPGQAQIEYDRALAEYKAAVRAIEDARESVTVEQIKAAIKARDQLHQIIFTEYPGHRQSLVSILTSGLRLFRDLLQQVGQFFLQLLQFVLVTLSGRSHQMQHKLNAVRKLDDSLRMRSRLIRRVVEDQRVVPLTSLHEVLDNPKPQWLRLFKSSKPWHDRYDWLWRGISLVCFIWAMALLVDTINRYLTGGVSTSGIAAILGTVLLTLLSSGGTLTNFGQGELEKIFESFEVPQKWWDEWRCGLSVVALALLIVFRVYGLPIASNCYAREPQGGFWDISHCFESTQEKAQSDPKVKTVRAKESRYQRSIALNPDNFEPYLKLAQLYEDELDYDNALKTYQTASRVAELSNDTDNKHRAEIGSVRVLLNHKKLDQADEKLQNKLQNEDELRNQHSNSADQIELYQIRDAEEYQILKNMGLAYLEADDSGVTKLLQQLLDSQGNLQANSEPLQPSVSKSTAKARYWFKQGLDRTAQNEEQQYEMRSYLGWTYMLQGDFSNAKPLLNDAVKLRPQEPLAQCLLAQNLYESVQVATAQSGLLPSEINRDKQNFEQATEACLGNESTIESSIESSTVKDLKATVRKLQIEQKQRY